MVIILLVKIILIWTCIWSNYIILENEHFINVVLIWACIWTIMID